MGQLTSVLDTSFKVPRAFVKVSLGVGARSPGSSAMATLLVGSKTGTGTTAITTRSLITSPDDASVQFGPGSELHLGAIAFFKANPIGLLYCTALDDSSGGALALKAFVFTGTATADGQVEIWLGGFRIAVSIFNGDTATVFGDRVAAQINGLVKLPCTAVNVTGTVTITMKNKGTRFNTFTTRSKQTNGAGIAHTPVTGTMAGGTDTGANPQTQLDAVASFRHHYLGSGFTDSVNLLKFKSDRTSRATPIEGKRGRWIGCTVTTLALAITLSDAINDPRGELIWARNTDDLPIEIAASACGIYSAYRSADRAANLDGFALPGMDGPFADSDNATELEQNTALNNGMTPVRLNAGVLSIVRPVTNYHNDPVGGNDDYSILDTHYVEVSDYIADLIVQNFAVFAGFKLGVDGPDDAPPAPLVATPKGIRDWLFNMLKGQENKLIVNVDALKGGIVVEADVSAAGRVNAEVPIDCIELFHQLGAQVSQVG